MRDDTSQQGHDTAMDDNMRKPTSDENAASLRKKAKVTDNPETTTGGTGKLSEGGAPNPGFTARGD